MEIGTLKEMIYLCFINSKAIDVDDILEHAKRMDGKLIDIVDGITMPLVKDMEYQRIIDYFRFVGGVRDAIYRKLPDSVTKKYGYFSIMPDPPIAAYDYIGENSLEVVEDNTIYARMIKDNNT